MLLRQLAKRREEIGLAPVAAILRIVSKARRSELVSFHDHLPDAAGRAEILRLFDLTRGDGIELHRHRDSLIAEHLAGLMKKEGRVHTAGKSDGDRAKCFQMCFKRFLLEKNALMDH